MHEIDGSYGEGGGQLLRTSVALSAITGEPLQLRNIRAKRANPGLAPQHLTAVQAVAALCGAEVEGLAVKSTELIFWPEALRAGEFDFDIGTAGSITLVLQAALPVAIHCGGKVRMTITGGTDVHAAPSLDYFRHVLLPLLSGMGVRAKIDVSRRGYYPVGGGRVSVEVEPSASLSPLTLGHSGSLTGIGGLVHVSNLPSSIATRMADAVLAELSEFPPPAINIVVRGREEAIGPGGAVVFAAGMKTGSGNTKLGASAVAQRGVSAEILGRNTGRLLREEILSGATLDMYAADQMLIYLALARSSSCFLAGSLSSHALTTIWLLEQFLPVRFSISEERSLVRVKAEPSQARRQNMTTSFSARLSTGSS